MIEVTQDGKVIYKSEHNAVGRFPEPGDEELFAGPSRNFQVFDPLDFLAEVTQHIPHPGAHLVKEFSATADCGTSERPGHRRRSKRWLSVDEQEQGGAPMKPDWAGVP